MFGSVSPKVDIEFLVAMREMSGVFKVGLARIGSLFCWASWRRRAITLPVPVVMMLS